MKAWALTLLMLSCMGRLSSQDIQGSVSTAEGQPLPAATVIVKARDSARILAYTLTNNKGRFAIERNKISVFPFMVEVRHVGFGTVSRSVNDLDSVRPVFDFVMTPVASDLKEIVIKREMPVAVKGDTVVFHADAFMGPEVRKVEELLGNMQGFSIDASGRLNFNGKRVEKVMIDGEDLAGRNYQLITKNLGAQFIDKVEVIRNYNENRLLKDLGHENAVGVNLKLKKKFHDRISANAEAGLSFQDRYHADINGFRLAGQVKLFSFLAANNTANDAMGNAGYYYEQEGGNGSSEEIANPGQMLILGVGQIPPPPVNEKYWRDNNDLGLAVLGSAAWGPKTKMRMIAGYQDIQAKYASNSRVHTYIDPVNSWYVGNDMQQALKTKDLWMKISVHHDDQKKRVDEAYLESGGGINDDAFLNNTYGDLQDSLKETFGNRRFIVNAGWKTTRLGKNGKLMVIQAKTAIQNSKQSLFNLSSRYAALFGLDTSYDHNKQWLDMSKQGLTGSLSWYGKRRKWEYQYGLIAGMDAMQFGSLAVISGVLGDTANKMESRATDLLFNGFFKGSISVGRKGQVSIDAKGGMERFGYGEIADDLFNYDLALNYVCRFSVLNNLRVGVMSKVSAPPIFTTYPAPLISGNGSVLGGLEYNGPAASHSLQASYHANNYYKQLNWSLTASYLVGSGQYNSSVVAQPEYTLSYMALYGGNHTGFFVFSIEKYLSFLAGKTGLRLMASDMANRFSANTVNSLARSRGFQSEYWWISGFRFPLNLECRFRMVYSRSSWAEYAPNTAWQLGWNQKLKWTVDKRTFGSLVWNAGKLSRAGKIYHGLDLFIQHKFGARITGSVRGHNLLNTGRLREYYVQPYSDIASEFRLVGRYILFGFGFQW